jgi:hypothetical protein
MSEELKMKRDRSARSRGSRLRNSRYHLGIGFDVWTDQQSWFWFVANPHWNGGAIGAAASEAEAVHEACSSIEEMPANRRAGAAALPVIAKSTAAPSFHLSNSISLTGWEGLLANLERYLTSACGAAA